LPYQAGGIRLEPSSGCISNIVILLQYYGSPSCTGARFFISFQELVVMVKVVVVLDVSA